MTRALRSRVQATKGRSYRVFDVRGRPGAGEGGRKCREQSGNTPLPEPAGAACADAPVLEDARVRDSNARESDRAFKGRSKRVTTHRVSAMTTSSTSPCTASGMRDTQRVGRRRRDTTRVIDEHAVGTDVGVQCHAAAYCNLVAPGEPAAAVLG